MAVTRSVEISSAPDTVWELVSDLPGMGRFSPENAGGSWRGGAAGPAVGVRFRGVNRRGGRRWSTDCVVRVCERGRAFGFDVSALGLRVSRWTYTVEPRPGGCRLTESWEDRRGPLVRLGGRLVSGVSDREAHNVEGIERTLAAVKEAAELSG